MSSHIAQRAGACANTIKAGNTPAIAEYPLTLECRVLYTQKQDLSLLPEDIRKSDYPAEVDGTAPLANRDPHTVYIGEIVNAYILKNT